MERLDGFQLQFRHGEVDAEVITAKGSRGVSVQVWRFRQPVDYEFSWDGTSHYLCYHDLLLIDGAVEVHGEPPVAGIDLRDTITYVPAGRKIHGWAKPVNRLNSFTLLSFDPAAMETDLQMAFKRLRSRVQYIF